MKLDIDPSSGHSAVLSKHDSPQFRYMKDTAIDDEPLNAPKLECVMTVEDLSRGTENKTRDSVGSLKIPSRKVSRSGKTDVRASKLVRPCELPELLVCYKDNAYALKDICVDEKVCVKDENNIGNTNDKSGCTEVPCDGNKRSVLTKESDSDEFFSPDGSLRSSENDDSIVSQEIKCSLESTFVYDGPSGETDSGPTNKIVADVLPGETFTAVPLSPDFSSQKTLMSFLLSSDYDGNEFDQPANKIPCSEVMYGIPVSSLAYNSTLDCTATASEFNSRKLAYNGVDEAQGESSFSMAGTSSDRVTCSGPMLIYSGSVSIRSDSSSTRSFAFPILQPEWHTSPVKMAKPDRRQYRKHRGWKQALFCCKF